MKPGSSWRWYDPERHPGDPEAVSRLHHAMEKRLGCQLDQPDLGKAPVIAAIVREAKDGEITHCLFLEAEVEACLLAETPAPLAEMKRAVDEMLLPILAGYKIRLARSFAPTAALASRRNGKSTPVERILRRLGFTKEDASIQQFFRWLVKPESGKQVTNG